MQSDVPTIPAATFAAVSKRYGPVTALDGVDFEIRRGETVALLGPDGAGKSTIIGLLLGLEGPDSGRIAVLGGSPEHAVAAGRVAAMLQEGDLPPGATAIKARSSRRVVRCTLPGAEERTLGRLPGVTKGSLRGGGHGPCPL